MANLNLDIDFLDHPKTRRLVGLLGRGAETLVLRLWCHAGKYHPADGALIGYSAAELESVIRWEGEPGQAIQALIRVGYLDEMPDKQGFTCHDWKEHEGHLIAGKERAKNAATKRWEKMRRQRLDEMKSDPPALPDAVPAPDTSNARSMPEALPNGGRNHAPDLTLPDQTIPDQQHQHQKRRNGKATADVLLKPPETAANTADPLEPSARTLEQHLLACWGRQGRLGWNIVTDLVALGSKHGFDALFDAIRQAGEYGKPNAAYVRGILDGPRKIDPAAEVEKLRAAVKGTVP